MEVLEKTDFNLSTGQESIFAALPDPALIFDITLHVVKVNSVFIDKFGCNPAGLAIQDLIPVFSGCQVNGTPGFLQETSVLQALKGEKTSGVVVSPVKYDAGYMVDMSSAPIYTGDSITGVLCTWHFISTNEKVNQPVSRKEEFNHVDDLSPVGVIINKNGVIDYANDIALKILGAKRMSDIEGKTAFDFFYPKYKNLLARRIEDLHAGKLIAEVEEKIIRIDGEERDVEIKAINISDADNKIIKVYLRDISSEKKLNYYNSILNSIEQVLQSSINIMQITRQVMVMVADAFHCDSAAVAFLNNNLWEVRHIYKFDESVHGMILPEDEEPHAQLALKSKKIIFIENAEKDPRVNYPRLQAWGIRSVIVVPLYTNKEKIGVIFFNFNQKKHFNHEEIYFLIRFSSALSLALENSELFDHLQQELSNKENKEKRLIKLNNILLALSRSSQAMVHATSEKEYISHICHIITSDYNQALAWVGFPDGKNIIPRIWSGVSRDYVKSLKIKTDNSSLSKGPTGLAFKNKKAFVCNNIAEDPGFRPWRKKAMEYGLNSSISLPLIHQNHVFGVLNIYSKELNYYAEDEILLLSELAKYLSHGIVSIRLDMAKKLAEDSLKESEERFRMITEKSNALICELDINGRVLYANAQYLDIFGWKEPFSQSILDNCKPADRQNFYSYIYQQEKAIKKTEWFLKDKNDNWRWFRCHPGIFKTSRGGNHFSLVLFDISESKLSEQQLKQNAKELKELNATKDKFFTIIAHDLKNPFSNLIGASELLATNQGFDPETLQKLGKIINDSAHRGYNLLQNLLDWSRSQTGTISFDPKKMDLSELIRDCWDNVKASALNKEQKVEITIPENLEITADYNMLHTVIRNLVQNAVKFTGNKGNIKISAQSTKKEVLVMVEDNGTGISNENLRKLFRMDIKFTSPGTNKETGTGLGLLLCKEFVERHGGRIGVKSREGHGSRFYFAIPYPAD